jgi:hypothetical protein
MPDRWFQGPRRDDRAEQEEYDRYGAEREDEYSERRWELMERLADKGSVDVGAPEVRELADRILRGPKLRSPMPTVERLEAAHEPPPGLPPAEYDEAA